MCGDFVLHHVNITSVEKIFKKLNVAKASGIDQISARFLYDGYLVIASHLAYSINLSKKLDTFPLQDSKKNPSFKKGIKIEVKNYRAITLLPLISNVIEKSIDQQTQNYFKEMNCCTVTSQVLESIISQIHVCLN